MDTENIRQVQMAKTFFKSDQRHSIYLSNDFINLSSDLYTIKNSMQKQFQNISQDIWNIGTIISRLDWTQLMLHKNEITEDQWMYFASLDIDHFHIELKSIMDYVAEIIRLNSIKSGAIPQASFRKLNNWMRKSNSNENKIGREFVEIINFCSWLPDYRKIRDSLIHQGGHTLIFPDKNRILFQTYGSSFEQQVKIKGLMYNENVVDFKKYAVLAFSRILIILSELAQVIRKKYDIQRFGIGDNKMISYGFDTYLKWTEDFIFDE